MNVEINNGNIGGYMNQVINYWLQFQQPLFSDADQGIRNISSGEYYIMSMKVIDKYLIAINEQVKRGVDTKRYSFTVNVTDPFNYSARLVFQNGGNSEKDVIILVETVLWFACIACGVSFADFAHSEHVRVGQEYFYRLSLKPEWYQKSDHEKYYYASIFMDMFYKLGILNP